MSLSGDLGRRGEALAEAQLLRAGWTILARNWRFGRKEIDLIATDAEVVVFVEVKSRSGSGFGGPLAALTLAKRRNLTTAARAFLAERGWARRNCRFDVIGVLFERGEVRIQHLPGAFDAVG